MININFNKFKSLSKKGNLIPIFKEVLADLETPISIFMKLQNEKYAFLFESVEGGEKWGRYTFLGANPRLVFRLRKNKIILEEKSTFYEKDHENRPFDILKEILDQYTPVPMRDLPRFYGGAVGFMGYETIQYFEQINPSPFDTTEMDDAIFLITESIIIYDRIRHTFKIVNCVFINEGDDLQKIYDNAILEINRLSSLLEKTLQIEEKKELVLPPLRPETPKKDFIEKVIQAKEYILNGDIFQIVLSQSFCASITTTPIHLYRALRFINPSPYLFFLKFEDSFLVGSSPEVMVRLEDKIVELKPIAGTRKRGKTEQIDNQLANELLEDPKEKAEHVMLVDLGRNDVGKISKIGSVQVTQLMNVEKYSHVMHLVSSIQGHLEEGKSFLDVLKAVFPAGTLTGAPKIRAMELIRELETRRRGPYGGSVGYFSYTGNMDLCITIRTLQIHNGKIQVQAGAGIVADSRPEEEYQEILNKAEGMMLAIKMAANGFGDYKKEN